MPAVSVYKIDLHLSSLVVMVNIKTRHTVEVAIISPMDGTWFPRWWPHDRLSWHGIARTSQFAV